MSVAVTYTSMLKTVETLTDTNIASSDATVTFNSGASEGINKTTTMNSGTTPPATKRAGGELTLTAGAGSIDLRALTTGVGGSTVDGNGLKVQAIKLRNKSTNANAMTISEGASNGYALLGASFTFILQPGQEIMFFGNDATPDVAAADKTIDVAGTGSQVLAYEVVMG